jgi:hypothetical protein
MYISSLAKLGSPFITAIGQKYCSLEEKYPFRIQCTTWVNLNDTIKDDRIISPISILVASAH